MWKFTALNDGGFVSVACSPAPGAKLQALLHPKTWNKQWGDPQAWVRASWSWCSQASRRRVGIPTQFALCFHLLGCRIIIPGPGRADLPKASSDWCHTWYFWLSLVTAVTTCTRGIECCCPELWELSVTSVEGNNAVSHQHYWRGGGKAVSLAVLLQQPLPQSLVLLTDPVALPVCVHRADSALPAPLKFTVREYCMKHQSFPLLVKLRLCLQLGNSPKIRELAKHKSRAGVNASEVMYFC